MNQLQHVGKIILSGTKKKIQIDFDVKILFLPMKKNKEKEWWKPAPLWKLGYFPLQLKVILSSVSQKIITDKHDKRVTVADADAFIFCAFHQRPALYTCY